MSLFGTKEKRFIGIDIGAGGVKLVELLYEQGKFSLMTYGSTLRTADTANDPLTDDPTLTTKHIKRLMKEAGVEGKDVIASLPVHAVFSSIIAIPKVKEESDVRALVERQAAKLMPFPLEDMVIDYQVLDEKGFKKADANPKQEEGTVSVVSASRTTGADENVRVLITGAQRKMVKAYTQIFQDAGLDLTSLETEPFALIRSLVGDDRSPIMILDVGAYRTNMTIVDEGVPFINRSIKVGGAMVTRQIAKQMSVSVEEAEQMKYDLRANGGDTPRAVKDLFQPIVNEIAYAMQVYMKSELNEHDRVDKVILTGGSALLPGLDTYLTEQLDVRTLVGDPWARVRVNESLRPVLDEIGPRFAVAVGLAMHKMKQAQKKTPAKAKKAKKN